MFKYLYLLVVVFLCLCGYCDNKFNKKYEEGILRYNQLVSTGNILINITNYPKWYFKELRDSRNNIKAIKNSNLADDEANDDQNIHIQFYGSFDYLQILRKDISYYEFYINGTDCILKTQKRFSEPKISYNNKYIVFFVTLYEEGDVKIGDIMIYDVNKKIMDKIITNTMYTECIWMKNRDTFIYSNHGKLIEYDVDKKIQIELIKRKENYSKNDPVSREYYSSFLFSADGRELFFQYFPDFNKDTNILYIMKWIK